MATKRERLNLPYCTEHSIWRNMWTRCLDPSDKAYERYGGAGVTVCERWRDFFAFVEDMGRKPAGHSLDRRDPSGHYEPDNCRWATSREQSRNRRDKRMRFHNWKGQRLTTTEIARLEGIHYSTLQRRVKEGYSIEAAVRISRENLNKQAALLIAINGVTKTLHSWCEIHGILPKVAWQRVHRDGWDWKRAITTPPITADERNYKRDKITINGVTKGVNEWLREYGLSSATYHKRVTKYGWTKVNAIITPVQTKSRAKTPKPTPTLITANGETKNIAQWSRSSGIPDGTIRMRLKKGWPPEKAVTQPVSKRHQCRKRA